MLSIKEIRIEGKGGPCVTDRRPGITFSLESDRPGESLKHAVIRVGSWEMETDHQLDNLYEGHLEPFTRYGVHIRAESMGGETAEGETFFETGRLDVPWTAKWIGDTSYDFGEGESPLPMEFRRTFSLEAKRIRRAWFNATAWGIYKLWLNGNAIGEDYFAPGFTSYAHQMQYQTYDVTGLLSQNNTLTAVVAGGWAVGIFHMKRKNKISADRQALLCELHVEYEDGSQMVLGTDESWKVTEDGPFRAASWYDGEIYDATVDESSLTWKPASLITPRENPMLLAQYGPPVRKQEVLTPVAVNISADGETIFDFGQNFAGIIAAELEGIQGQTVTFRHAELLVDGALFVKPLRTAKATATYICRDGRQEYSPTFTYMGFRYVGVKGVAPEKLKLKAYVLHSQFEESGRFFCSNVLINQLQSNIRWSGKSNFLDIPTDCPQRDERLGWTGDIAVFAQTACYNFDLGPFFDKWLLDMNSEQGPGGGIPYVIPQGGDDWRIMASACWGDSCVMVPWAEYMARGNLELLRRQYPVMKRFLSACRKWGKLLSVRPSRRRIIRWPYQWGDWCALDGEFIDWILRAPWVATAYYASSCRIAAKVAAIMGEAAEADYYDREFHETAKAYRKVFLKKDGRLKKEFQTAYVLPLAFGMVDGETASQMAEYLQELLEKQNGITTGFPGTPYILYALSDNGRPDLAYRLLVKETCPSWLYEVKTGATTIWERWDALRPDGTINTGELKSEQKKEDSQGGMVSFNHYANGAVGDWLYRRLLGLEPMEAGYREFRFKPVPGGGIEWAAGSVKTPYGEIKARWEQTGDDFLVEITVPVSTECHVVFPGGAEEKCLGSGIWNLRQSRNEEKRYAENGL